MPIYRANIQYNFLGQPMENVLWYRDTGGVVGLDPATACAELGERVRDNIILPQVGQTRLLDIWARGVTAEVVEVSYLSAPNLDPLLSAPVLTNVGVAAPVTNAAAYAPESAAIIRLNCGITTVNPLDYTPRRGYFCFGPLAEDATLENGQLGVFWLTALSNLSAALLAVQDIGGGFTATPIRVGRGRNSVGTLVNGFADIVSASVRADATWRRSRSG